MDASIVAVVTDDIPYLVHSVTAELTRDDTSINLLVHPSFRVLRDPVSHELLEVRLGTSMEGETPPEAGETEVWIAAEIGRLPDAAAVRRLTDNLQRVLDDVRVAIRDGSAIRGKLAEAVASVDGFPRDVAPPPKQLRELLLWLDDGNFLFLGYTEGKLTTAGGQDLLVERQGAALGLLRRPEGDAAEASARRAGYPRLPSTRPFHLGGQVHSPEALVPGPSSRENVRSGRPHHRRTTLLGLVHGRCRSPVGPPNSGSQGEGPGSQRKAGVYARSQQARELMAVLETFPRDELFHIEADDLARLAGEILRAEVLQRIRVFLRPDSFGRFVSALVFFPRRRYSTAVRLLMEDELKRAFGRTL
ncbi:NAD-specific glutamate dehydrogenase [Arthrobacter sp. Hiyo8]|nr:NAD-specific glutamate dehydrogenase [Arthrobacter sp. Hiyo8]